MQRSISIHMRWIAVGLALIATAALAAPVPDAKRKARADALFAAVSSGDPAQFEAMATESFAPDMLARRSPAERRQMMERLKADFGQMQLADVRVEGDTRIVLLIAGSQGLKGRFDLQFEAHPPYRIVRFAIGAGGNETPGGLEPPIGDAGMTPAALFAALDAEIDTRVAAEAFSGVVLVARDGVPVYSRAAGFADRMSRLPATPDTRYNIASIGKIFTKVAIAQLVAQGKLALSNTIGELLPDHPVAEAHPATIEQLLTHQGGIANFFGPAFETVAPTLRSNADFYQYVASQPLSFQPGSRREYCNGCYVVLGAIIERVSGMRYENYIAQHVFAAAGMRSAGFFHSDRLPAATALGYTRRAPGTDSLTDSVALHGIAGSAAGGVYATAQDLLAFELALRTHRLADAAATAQVLGSAPATTGRNDTPLGIAGGAPGTNALLEGDGTWTVIVLGNLDPPAAGSLGLAIQSRLAQSGKTGGPLIRRQ